MTLCGITIRFQMLFHSERQVTHALLTRPPLIHPSVDRSLRQNFIVRLACVKHAASVRPEPGSNSLKIISKHPQVFKPFLELNRSFRHSLTFLFRFRNLCKSTFCFRKTLEIFSGFLFHRCLIFKVLTSVWEPLSSRQLCYYIKHLPLCQHFF